MTDILTYHNGITDCWKFMRFYLENGDPKSPEYWVRLLDSLEEINEKYQSEFIKKILFAMAKELEERAKA